TRAASRSTASALGQGGWCWHIWDLRGPAVSFLTVTVHTLQTRTSWRRPSNGTDPGESAIRMIGNCPNGSPSGLPAACQGRVREVARLQWWVGQAGHPAAMIERFLAGYGLPVTDLSTLSIGPTATDPHTNAHGPGGVCGAALLVSAAGGAAMIDAPVGAPSPAPAVPDVAVVVYEHAESPTRLITQSDRDLPDWRLGEWVPSWSSDDHAAAVETVRAAIARGDVYQVNVVGHWAAPYEGDPRAALG